MTRATWVLLGICLAGGGAAAAEAPANLVGNAGLEQWAPARQEALPGKPLVPDGLPAGWSGLQEAYERGDSADFPIQGSIHRDTAVRHAGEAAVRFENGLATDISEVSQGPFAVQPNSVYRVTCWVRGEGIVPNPRDGCGIIVWANTGPGAPGSSWDRQTPLARSPRVRSGTFDWQRFEFDVETGPDAGWMRLVLQLRRAAGKAWYDDVSVARVAAIHRVESY